MELVASIDPTKGESGVNSIISIIDSIEKEELK